MADNLKAKIDKAGKVLTLLNQECESTRSFVPGIEQQILTNLQQAVEAVTEMSKATQRAQYMLDLAQKHYKTYDQKKSKLTDLQKFSGQLDEELTELQTRLIKTKDSKLKKEIELKQKASAKNQDAVAALSGDVESIVTSIETVAENFSDAAVKPVIEGLRQIHHWADLLRRSIQGIDKIDTKIAEKFDKKVAECEKLLK
jgi:chromosome segregation ATPase